MLLVDVHTHLDHERFKEDLDAVVQRAREAGVTSIITSGVNTATNRIVLGLAEKYDIVNCSFGIYPLDALEKEMEESSGFVRDVEKIDVDKELAWIEENKDKCIAVGECGLDRHFVQDRDKEQQAVFQKIIEVVEKIKKPIIIHSRKAELDCIEMLESSKIKKVVMHSFGGKKSLIKRAADLGFSFSVPPVITRLQHFETLVGLVDISQLLTETDAPYLSPYPGERNEPAFVKETIKKIAEIKNMTEDDVANNIYMNYTNVFL